MIYFYKGRVALYTILKAMGITPGGEVIIPAYTCVVVPNAILYLGAKPVYADIELKTFSVKPDEIRNKINSNTKAVICQNTYGLSAYVDEIVSLCKERGIFTVEDCTHGYGGTFKGKPNGSYCDAAFYSSQWNKPFSTGLGGYAVVQDKELNKKVLSIIETFPYPSIKTILMLWVLLKIRGMVNSTTYYALVDFYRYLSRKNIVTGSSSGEEIESTIMPRDYLLRMSNLQLKEYNKAIKKLPQLNDLRKTNGSLYTEHLLKLNKNHVNKEFHGDHLFLKYPLLVSDRREFFSAARKEKIPLGDWFLSPLHPVEGDLSPWGFDKDRFPKAVFAAEHVVNLPTDTKKPEKVLEFIEKYESLILPVID